VTKRYYPHYNHLYSVAALTSEKKSDGTVEVVERYKYTAYGKQTITSPTGVVRAKSAVGFDLGFTGFITDNETGLLHARARQYSPTLGRFIGKDEGCGSDLEPRAMGTYPDGMNGYAAYFAPNKLDPNGCSVIEFYFAAFINSRLGTWLPEPTPTSEWQFKTDERGFGSAGSSRIRSDGYLESCNVGNPPEGANHPGASHRRHRARGGGWRHETATTTLSTDKVDATGWKLLGVTCVSKITFTAAGNYPFTASPDIDYVATFVLKVVGKDKIEVTVSGKHDGFPDYEAYVNGQKLYNYSAPDPGPSLWNLGGGPEVGFSGGPVILNVPTPKCCHPEGGSCP
jgi:RHS repeat-associated protein